MPSFSYNATASDRKVRKGVIEAIDAAHARQLLRGKNLLPLKVVENTKRFSLQTIAPNLKTKMPAKTLALFTRQLSTLLSSGVRIEVALLTISKQADNVKISNVAKDLRASLLDGKSLGAATEEMPYIFDRFYRACLVAGEVSGRLPQITKQLADHVELNSKNKQAIQLAMIYPTLLALVSVAVIIALLVFVVPDIISAFSARGAELPWLTKSLISTSTWVSRYGLLSLILISFTFIIANRLITIDKYRRKWHSFLANFPFTRGPVLRIAAMQFTGTLATLVSSNVALSNALSVASETLKNQYLKDKLVALSKEVSEGKSLSKGMEEANIFPPMTIAMVVSGEFSGNLGSSLQHCANDQLADVNAFVKTLVGLVEPAVLLIMGGLVMLLVLAILLPIINLNQLVG